MDTGEGVRVKPFEIKIEIDPNYAFGWDDRSLADSIASWVSSEIEKEVRKGVREQIRNGGHITGIVEVLVKAHPALAIFSCFRRPSYSFSAPHRCGRRGERDQQEQVSESRP